MLRLERQFGLCGIVLQWFRSYLSDQSYQVIYGDNTSSTVYITCSVPQGSVLGPCLFISYTADLVEKHDVNLHAYADDTQLYLKCFHDEMTFAATRLEHCLTDVSHWRSANRLKLNSKKTELVWVSSRYVHTPLGSGGPSLQLGTDTAAASDYVHVLGVTISSDLSLDKHVSNVCVKCFFWLRQLRRVRRSLDVESVKTLVHAFVTTRLDYCNSVLAGVLRSVTDKLQRVLNAAARLVSDTRKFDRGLSRLLHVDLHWLDVPERSICAPPSQTANRSRQHKNNSRTSHWIELNLNSIPTGFPRVLRVLRDSRKNVPF